MPDTIKGSRHQHSLITSFTPQLGTHQIKFNIFRQICTLFKTNWTLRTTSLTSFKMSFLRYSKRSRCRKIFSYISNIFFIFNFLWYYFLPIFNARRRHDALLCDFLLNDSKILFMWSCKVVNDITKTFVENTLI